MIHMTFSEPEVMLLVTLLRAVPFVLLGSNICIDSLEVREREAMRGKSRKGMIR